MKPLKLNWRMVLVRPRNPLNIGAAARAMANFGLMELAVVAPFEPTWAEARSTAVGAGPVITSARAVPTLAEAIDDATLVVGTTTGSRRNLGREILPLPELAALASPPQDQAVGPRCFSVRRRPGFRTKT